MQPWSPRSHDGIDKADLAFVGICLIQPPKECWVLNTPGKVSCRPGWLLPYREAGEDLELLTLLPLPLEFWDYSVYHQAVHTVCAIKVGAWYMLGHTPISLRVA